METFKREINAEAVRFKYEKGISSRTGREIHPYYEIILFFGERAELFSDLGHTAILPNTLVVIPKESYHQLNIIGDPHAYHRCVINFSASKELKPLIGESMTSLFVCEAGESVALLFQKLIKITESDWDEDTKKLLLHACLPLLLSELSQNEGSVTPLLDPVARGSVAYINAHLGEELSVAIVARHLNVSPSLLSHAFKKEMNISFYQYVLKKRLTHAFRRIQRGDAAAVVARECGFCDYSNFYRQYKKAFGCAPSDKKG